MGENQLELSVHCRHAGCVYLLGALSREKQTMRAKTALFFLVLLVLAAPMIVRGQSRSFGVVIQTTDYDSEKDQTTFHLLYVCGKGVQTWGLSLHVTFPD